MNLFFAKLLRAKYPALSFWENFFGGHVSIGNITIYGENAMCWAVVIRTKKYGCICFTLPFKTFGEYRGCHIYFSPNGTPWACTYYKSIWKEDKWQEEIRAKVRFKNFGHNFDTEENWGALKKINDTYDSMLVDKEYWNEKIKLTDL